MTLRPGPLRPAGPLCLLVLLPILIHLPVLSPWLSADPILWWSGLVAHFPGEDHLVPGQPGWADGNAGVTTEALGHLAAEDWLSGVAPWWNPYSGIGMPLAAEMQNSALFLPFVLLLHFGRGVLLLKISMQVATGLAMFGLLRSLRLRVAVAMLGAVLAEFNGTFAWFAHGPIMPVASLPLLMLGIERCRIEVERAARTWPAMPVGLVAGAVAFSIVAGFPETAFIDGLLAAVFAVARVFSLGRAARLRFALALCGGVAAGVLLAAPAWVPFLDFLRHADLSVHADLSSWRLLPQSGAMLLLPLIYGPILANNLATGSGADDWWHAGGYIGLPLATLAVASLLGGRRRELGLRLAVAGWMAASFGRAEGVPVLVAIFDAVPFVRHALFANYVQPSWEIGAVLLGAFAVEDWLEAGRARLATGALVLGAVVALTSVAIVAAWPEIARLAGRMHHYGLLAGLPSMLTAAAAVVVAGLLWGRATRLRWTVLGAVVCLDAVGNFAAPLLSAAAARPLDEAPVAFLRAHLGWQRFYAVDAFKPNYGAYEGLASVNYNYLPIPKRWVDFLHAHLSGDTNDIEFFGRTLVPVGGGDEAFEQADRPAVSAVSVLGTLASLGVRFVVARHGRTPLTETQGTSVEWRDPVPHALAPGQSMSFSFRPRTQAPGADLLEAAVVVGTYAGRSDGRLMLSVCTGGVCRRGSRSLARAGDNALFGVALDGALALGTGALTVTIGHQGGTVPVAVYEWPEQSGAGRAPLFTFGYQTEALRLKRVFADEVADIYALPDAAPYAQTASGRCRLAIRSRLLMRADCDAPDRLIRRELFYPGWRAWVDGRQVPVARQGPLFQSVGLPAGRSEVRFSYAPPFIGWAVAASCLGLGGLAVGFAAASVRARR